MPRGRLPTGMVATTALVRGETTEMCWDFIGDVSSGSRELAPNGACGKEECRPGRRRAASEWSESIGTSRSVVEDRLVDVQRLASRARPARSSR